MVDVGSHLCQCGCLKEFLHVCMEVAVPMAVKTGLPFGVEEADPSFEFCDFLVHQG